MEQDSHKVIMNNGLSHVEASPSPPLPAAALAAECVRLVGQSLHNASAQIQRVTAAVQNECHLRFAMSMVLRLPKFLPLLKEYPELPDPNARYIPACPLCQVPPGVHWAHDCPTIPPRTRDKYIFDYRRNKLVPYKDLEADPDPRDYAPGKIPRCGICGKGPGAHWPDRCPDNPIADKMYGDRVVPPSEQDANRVEKEDFDD